MVIQKKEIAAGENKEIKINIGNMPSGDSLHMRLKVFRSRQPGPCLLLMAGVHGDEVNGVEIISRILADELLTGIERGSIIVIPIVNVYGFIHRSRELPDGKDINRSFPGNLSGSLASRMARILTKTVLPLADIVLDMHSGAHAHYNYPQIRYSKGDGASKLLGQAFAPPILLAKPPISKSLRKVAADMQKPLLIYEAGENNRLDELAIKEGLTGIRRLLGHLEMLPTLSESSRPILHFEKSSWMRAVKSGLFKKDIASGEFAQKGQLLGHINDPFGNIIHTIVAKRDGIIIGHNNAALVNQGDALFHLAI